MDLMGGGFINNHDLAVDSYTTGRLDGLDEDGGDAIMTLEGLLSGCFPIIWVLGGVGYLLQCGWLTHGRAPEPISTRKIHFLLSVSSLKPHLCSPHPRQRQHPRPPARTRMAESGCRVWLVVRGGQNRLCGKFCIPTPTRAPKAPSICTRRT
jgi:hypothetical protein